MPQLPPRYSNTGFSLIALIGAVAGLALGVTLAIIFLVLKPIETVEDLPEEPAAHTVYYIPGSKTKPSYWKQMRHALYSPKSIKLAVGDDDLNRWAANNFNIYAPPTTDSAPAAFVPRGSPNFRVDDDQLSIALNIDLSVYGAKIPILWQTHGYFEKTDWGFEFVPTDMYLGSMSIPAGFSQAFFGEVILPAFEEKPEYRKLAKIWAKLSWLKIKGNRLQIAKEE